MGERGSVCTEASLDTHPPSEEETGNLPEKEFPIMIVKMTEEFERRMDAQSKKLDVFNRVRK